MIVSAQSLATYLEQDYDQWSTLQKSRAADHILTAGDEVRGALAALYTIPEYTRDTSGTVTSPADVSDPVRTAIGPIVKMLAAAFLLNPSRGFQPQEDRSAATDYRTSARTQLKALQSGKAFITSIDKLSDYGIEATDALTAMLTSSRRKARPGLRQQREGMFGVYHNPETGEEFDSSAVSEGETP